MVFFFFFSSRRRHTRCLSDWSSDVCSSDLWRNTAINDGGIGKVKYTMAADMKHDIAKAYDVESEGGVAFRGAFLIDDNGVVRSQIINDLPLGRNMEELIRLVDALQFHEEHGEVCPANWKKGDKGMDASPEGVAKYLTEHAGKL